VWEGGMNGTRIVRSISNHIIYADLMSTVSRVTLSNSLSPSSVTALTSLPPSPSSSPSLSSLFSSSQLQAAPDVSDGTGRTDEGGTRACKVGPRGGKEVPEEDTGSPEKAGGSRRGETSCPLRAEDEGLAEPQEQH